MFKVGDLVNIQTYRNSGDIEAIGIFMGYTEEIRKSHAYVHAIGTTLTVPVFLLEEVQQ